MGFIRGALIVLVSVVLFITLLVGSIFLVLGNSLEYENIQNELVPFVKETADFEVLNQAIGSNYAGFVQECNNASEVVVSNEGVSLSISCDSVLESSDSFTDEIIEKIVDEIYYTDYDCAFFDCGSEEGLPLYVVSEHSMEYFEGWFYKSLLVILLLFVGLIFLVEKKSNAFVLMGGLMIVASLPFSKLEWFVSFIEIGDFLEIFGFLFTTSYSVFIKELVFGIIVLGIGIVLKFFSIGFKVQDFFSRFKGKEKVIVKNEPLKKVPKSTKGFQKPVSKMTSVPKKVVSSSKVSEKKLKPLKKLDKTSKGIKK